MAAAAGKNILVLVYGSICLGSGRRALHCGCSDLGRRDVDRQMAHRTKSSVDEPGFLRFRRGDKREDLQEQLSARPVIWASNGHSGIP